MVTHLLFPAAIWAAFPIPVSAIVAIKPPWAIPPVFKKFSKIFMLNSNFVSSIFLKDKSPIFFHKTFFSFVHNTFTINWSKLRENYSEQY